MELKINSRNVKDSSVDMKSDTLPIPRTDAEKNLPEGWVVSRLEDVVDILDSQRIPVNAKERENRKGKIPYYGATGQVGWIDDYLFDEELVLLVEDGGPFLYADQP